MKIILSRKGFDSQFGGQPSPIMPDGMLLSLPIPSQGDVQFYSRLKYGTKTYLQIIQELNLRTKIQANTKDYLALKKEVDEAQDYLEKLNEQEEIIYANYSEICIKYGKRSKEAKGAWNEYNENWRELTSVQKLHTKAMGKWCRAENEDCHLDPDLRKEVLKREKGWLPMFGQAGPAQGHLRKQGIKEGDLFLFFGWFKQTELVNGKLRYVKSAPHQHIIWGYMQIGKIWDMTKITDVKELPRWMQYHTHVQKRFFRWDNNTIYILLLKK